MKPDHGPQPPDFSPSMSHSMMGDESDENHHLQEVRHDDQEDTMCRICLEECPSHQMIAPCLCRGGSKFVHRACLDQWRTTAEDRAFARCTECHFEYRMQALNDEDEDGSKYRKLKYRMLISRDFLLIFLLVQVTICSIAFSIHGMDTAGCEGHTWAPFTKTDNNEVCDADPSKGERAICGDLRRLLLPCFIGVHDRSSYYIFGMTVFFAIIGLFGMMGWCCVHGGGCSCCDHHTGMYCYWCDCGHVDCTCPNCDGNCDCGNCNCDGGGDGAPFILVLAAIVCIVLAFVGLLLAVFFMAMVIQRVMQRHIHVMQKRTLAAHYVVQDLQLEDVTQLQAHVHTHQNEFDGAAPGQCSAAVAASAPSLSPPQYAELKAAGLI